jgi:hypothetical protein
MAATWPLDLLKRAEKGNPLSATDYDNNLSKIEDNVNYLYVDMNSSGFKNYIINGGFDVWQRGTSFNAVGYTSDRWRIVTSGLEVKKVLNENSKQLNIKALADGTNNISIRQPIELSALGNKRDFPVGKTYTLSFEILPTTSNMKARAVVRFSDAPSDVNIVELLTLTKSEYLTKNQFNKVSFTFTVNDIPNITNTCLTVQVGAVSDAALIGDTIAIKNVQLEEGSSATKFEQRPYGLELSLCQRYYQRFSQIPCYVNNNDPTRRFGRQARPVIMRVNPTETASIGSGTLTLNGQADYIGVSIVGATSTSDVQASNYTADAEL